MPSAEQAHTVAVLLLKDLKCSMRFTGWVGFRAIKTWGRIMRGGTEQFASNEMRADRVREGGEKNVGEASHTKVNNDLNF